MTAAASVGKLQRLDTLLRRLHPQTSDDHRNALRVLSEQTGIPARHVARGALKLVRKVA